MTRAVLVTACAGLVIASGVVDGRWSDRWSDRGDVRAAAAALAKFPNELGPWAGKPAELDRRQVEVAGIAGYALRRYVNRETGAGVTVLLVCGRPGAISVHTPDVCYAGNGYEPEGPPTIHVRVGPAGRSDEFTVADMARPAPGGPVRLRIFWSWSDGVAWRVPSQPRLTFARRPVLYKLYAFREPGGPPGPPGDDVCAEVIGRLLPEFDRVTAPGPPRAGPAG